jgi:hypothetical protein
MSKYKTFALFISGDVVLITDFKVLPYQQIQVGNNEPEHLADFGDYMLFDRIVSKEEAWSEFLNVI